MDREEPPDIEICACARAKKVRFASKPETRVDFDEHPAVESESRVEKENLPEEVEPRVTYRDVRVSWRASSRIGRRPT